MSQCFFHNRKPNLLYTFAGSPLRALDHECYRCRKSTEAKHMSPSDYRRAALNNCRYKHNSMNLQSLEGATMLDRWRVEAENK